jgi:hypothetical protein
MSGERWSYVGGKMEGSAAVPSWSDPATGECGTCHALPPAGHQPAEITDCALCHLGVIDGTGAIVAPEKHGNGRVNVFDDEYPMF